LNKAKYISGKMHEDLSDIYKHLTTANNRMSKIPLTIEAG